MHVFEKAGLGIAPFRLVRIEFLRYKACNDCPALPGSSCDYCGEGIVETCFIRDANGKEFKVGNVCVGKTGDRGLIDPVKQELNRLRMIARHEKEDAKIAEARLCLSRSDVAHVLKSQPHPYAYHAEKGKSLFDYCEFMLNNAGRKGGTEGAKVVIDIAKKLDRGEQAGPTEAEIRERQEREEAARLAAEAEARRREDEEAARIEKIRNDNAFVLNTLVGDGGFVTSMRRELQVRPLWDFSPRQLEILADIYAKTRGRRGSKAYQDAYWQVADAKRLAR